VKHKLDPLNLCFDVLQRKVISNFCVLINKPEPPNAIFGLLKRKIA
jgi:hypothetical protein